MKKKLLALLLTLCLVLGLFPIGVSAIDIPQGQDDGKLRLVEYHVTDSDVNSILREKNRGDVTYKNVTSVTLHYLNDGQEKSRNLTDIVGLYSCSFLRTEIRPKNITELTIKLKDGSSVTIDSDHLSAVFYEKTPPFYELTYYKPQYTLTYDANGGEVNPETVQVTEGDTVELNVTPTYEGNLFVGWTTDETVKDQIFDRTATDVPATITKIENVTAPLTVYAVWDKDENDNDQPDYKETKYTVTYKDGVNGKVFEDKVHENLLVDEKTPAFNKGSNPTREGYVFSGWEPTPATEVSGNAEYVAQWTEKQILVSFLDSDNSTPVRPQDTIKFTTTEAIVPPAGENVTPVSGKVFKGWGIAASDGTVTSYKGAYTYEALAELVNAKDGWNPDETEGYLTFTPVFEDEPVTEMVTFTYKAGEHGSLEGAVSEKVTVFGPKGAYPTNVPTPVAAEGYEFAGWQVGENPEGEVTLLSSDELKTLPFAQDTIFVAVFKEIPVTTKEVGVNYWDVENNTQAGEGKVIVDKAATSVNTSKLTDIPAGYELVSLGELPIRDGWVYVEVKPIPTTKEVGVNYWDVENNTQAGEGKVIVDKAATSVNTSKLTDIPAGYELVSVGDFPIRDGWVYIEVKPIEVSNTVIVNIRFMDGDEFIAGGDFFFEKDASVKFGDLALPEGYELDSEKNNAESGFVARDGAQIIVHVKKISTTGIMNIRFMDGETFVAGGDYFLPLGVQNYAVLAEYVPEGYRMCVAGDFMVTDGGKLDVPVEKIPTTGIMNIRFMDGDEFVAGGDYFLPLGVQNYSILTKYVPEGYRMCVAGDFMVTDGGKLDVPVEKIPTTGIMNIRFMDGDEFVAGGDYTLPLGVQNYSILTKYVPEGYRMCVAGDFMVTDGGKLDVPVEKIPTTGIMNIRFMDGDEFVAGGDYFLPLGVQNYSILTKYVPEGYRMCVAGDFMVTDGGKLDVPVEKIVEDTYTVTLVGEGNRAYGEGTYEAGETVTIYAGTKTGYSFDRWVTRDVTLRNADDSRVSFVMPEHDVTIRATWDRDDDDTSSSGKTYPIYIEETRDGEVESSHKRAAAGTTITLTVEPEDGSELVKLTVVDEDGDKINVRYHSRTDEYTFTMPASEVTVKAVFDSDLPFKDVSVDSWYYDAVSYVYRNGLMNGISATRFAPNAKLNRAMIAQVLYNLEGETRSYPTVFSDVADSAWYADAVNWAADKGIVEGYGNGKFGPEDNITREQMAAILYRYADYKGYDVRASARLSGFADEDQVSDWAEEAMSWAVAEDLMDGKGNNRLDPTGTATRAEVATILMRFCETIVEA